MTTAHNPASIFPPAGISAHGIGVPAGARLLFVSGQIATRPDGTVPEGIEAQTEVVWQKIRAVLADAGMGVSDIVKLGAFLTRPADYPAFAQVRARHMGEHRAASTAVFVPALVKPEWCVEIEVVAARVD